MVFKAMLWVLALAASVVGKECRDFMIPVSISARQGVYNVPPLQHNLDATTFNQNLTSIRGNFTDAILTGYDDVTGNYYISAQFCQPDQPSHSNGVVQFLTHGIGFDKTYWDLPTDDINYSYVKSAVDEYGYSTLAIDRFGIGKSSVADPMNTVQAPAAMSAIYEVTKQLRDGSLPTVNKSFDRVVHVGHSFGSALTYELVAMYPNISDGIILTGYSQNGTYVPVISAGMNWQLARLNQPARFRSLPSGYLTWANMGSNQYGFFTPGCFDLAMLAYAEANKMPATIGELLTLGSQPGSAPDFKGPVMVFTGSDDSWFCGFDCLATGNPALASIPADAQRAFPAVKAFEAYIQPNTGHALNMHRNATAGYRVMLEFLKQQGL